MPTLPASLTLGLVHLAVAQLERSLEFYQRHLGFQLHRREGATAYLGAGEADLLLLTEQSGARPVFGRTGLYHFAILVPSRVELAQGLRRLAETETPMQGFADHLVSEALYLADPDGNGIELYRDRPRTDWYDARGQFRMGTEPLDVDGLLGELKGGTREWAGLAKGTTLGHMHLKVANIPQAKQFYCEVLGFDLLMNWHNALFVSAGGYHHHLGLNTWESAGAPPPPPEATGLRHFTVRLPAAELSPVKERVQQAGVTSDDLPNGFRVRDPFQNVLHFVTA